MSIIDKVHDRVNVRVRTRVIDRVYNGECGIVRDSAKYKVQSFNGRLGL